MRWRKLGLLYAPDGSQAWARSHAMLPTPLVLSDNLIRLYVAHLDENSVGRIGFVDVAMSEPTRVLDIAKAPVLDVGAAGAFDDNGSVPSCAVPSEGRVRLYYSGFQLQRRVPYTIFSSLAIGDESGGGFARTGMVPQLDRVEGEAFFRAAPFVMNANGTWRMWYIGGDRWVDDPNGKKLPFYSLRYTESADGLAWPKPSIECLAPRPPDEIGFGRPFIHFDASGYRMWFSVRTRRGYNTLAYAESADGLVWERRDDAAGIACSESGWDSEMICYASVVATPSCHLMFYNGNGYGRTGVGVAVADLS